MRFPLFSGAVLLIPSFLCALTPPPPQEFRVTDVEGKAAVLAKGSSTPAPVTRGFPIQSGDRLITGDKGRVEIASKQGTVLELREKSYCRVQSLAPGRSSFFVRVGQLLGRFASSKETGIQYRISTPLVVAAVRGTDLGVVVNEGGETEAGVIEGKVDFSKHKIDSNAAIGWSDEDPRWTQLDEEVLPPSPAPEAKQESVPEAAPAETPVEQKPAAAPKTTAVETGQGIAVKPNAAPEKLARVPAVLVPSVSWFQSVRERVPKLRDGWKDLDVPSKMKMRQEALRERINWEIPAKLQPAKPAPNAVRPEKPSVPKKSIPRPK